MPKKVAVTKKAAASRRAAAAKKVSAAGLDEGDGLKVAVAKKVATDRMGTGTEVKGAAARRPARRSRKAAVPAVMELVPDPDDDLSDTADEPVRKEPATGRKPSSAKLVQLLNESLAWELRAQAMYAHYAAYVKGVESLTLAEHFEGEVTESIGHAKEVRDIIAALDGEAVSTRDDAEIVHTEDTRVMLEEALKTETAAAAAYRKLIPLVKDHPVFYHAIYHILKDEAAAVIEVETLLGR